MNKFPLITVVIPCYNHEKYVRECIQSVINQDYENIELIIIDDGSIDNSVEKIQSMVLACEKRFSRFSFVHRPNKGLSSTLNEAISMSKGQYFSAIASDDVMLPQKTSTLLQLILDLQVPGVFSGAQIIDSQGIATDTSIPCQRHITFKDIILRKVTPIAPSQLLDISAVKRVGGYVDGMYVEDFYMWMALTENGDRLYVTNDILIKYRVHGGNSRRMLKMYEERKIVLSEFSDNRYYQNALAVNAQVASFYQSYSSKTKALQFLIKSLGHCKTTVFSTFFYRCILRLLTPYKMLS